MIISVASGKGGTGKTLVATSLAVSLMNEHQVQLLDCDVEEPDCHIFLKPVITRTEPVYLCVPVVDKEKCTYCGMCARICAFNAIAVVSKHVMIFSNLCHGCGACSYLCPEGAITEEKRETGVIETGISDSVDLVRGKLNVGEAMPTPLIREVKNRVESDKVAIIDVPPGTSCPVVHSITGSDFCLLVTEPTPFGLNDLVLAVETVKGLGIKYGVVINRTGIGYAEVEEYCNRENIPVLLKIPLDTAIARLYSNGITLADGIPQWKESFSNLYSDIVEIVDERNRSLKR